MTLTAEELAERVRRAIERSDLTQEAAAKAAEMDPTALSKALSGKRNFSSLEIARLCDVLHLAPLALLDDGTPPPAPRAADVARIQHAAELDDLLTRTGFPRGKEGRYPSSLLDRAIEAWLAGQCSIRPIAGLLGIDADDLLDQIPSLHLEPRPKPSPLPDGKSDA